MGIIKKILGSTDGPKAEQQVKPQKVEPVQPASKKEPQTRQVGSIWEHRHDDLDWHSMSRPHPPAPDKEIPAAATPGEPPSTDESAETPISKQDVLCKFVMLGNEKIGETISLDAGQLIFKKGANRLAVPLSSIIEISEDAVTVGEFDREEALRSGNEWTLRTTDKLNFDEKGMLIK